MPLILVALALAGDAPEIEILVEEERNVAATRKALDEVILEHGYLRGIPLGGKRTLYMPHQIWKPRVTVHQEGMVRVKARAVTPLMLLTGVFNHPRVARAYESELLEAIHPEVVAWREAMSRRGQALRREGLHQLLFELRDLPEDHQRHVLARLWLDTADNDEGEAVRILVETFVVEERLVFGADEVEAMNAARRFERAWEPEYLGHDSWREPVPKSVERPEPEPEPECLEPVAPPVVPEGLSADILSLSPPGGPIRGDGGEPCR